MPSKDVRAFVGDPKTYDAVERCLKRISEAASKLGPRAEELRPRDMGNRRRDAGGASYSITTGPLCGPTFLMKNISGTTARKMIPSTQKLSTNASIADCRCSMP